MTNAVVSYDDYVTTSELTKQTNAVVQKLESTERLIVTKQGKPAIVMLPVAVYNELVMAKEKSDDQMNLTF